ncbi:hypothetical protein [Mycolicibacterium goodii]|uniref:DUF8129 domain-containing protein n=1 Tax=Mycolicibacterium goodii TaxID=134601 RepID=A0A0K0X686_MYCGD|nr:hypothetical protein AFA91_14000 [Mycolicibacterium goodii]
MSAELPLPSYDEMSLGDIQHKVRSLTMDEVEAVLTYEAGHAARVPVLEIVEARMRELEGGAEPSPGDPRRSPDIVANQTPRRGRT